MKYWEILLRKQRERGKDGLTIPFLVGSQKFLPERLSRQNINDLIRDIATSNSFETCLRYCMGTQTLIFEIKKSNNVVYYPKYNDQLQANLSVGIMLKNDLGESVENLIDKLTEKFQDPINKELFSAEPNVNERRVEWREFTTDDDIPFIKKSFESL